MKKRLMFLLFLLIIGLISCKSQKEIEAISFSNRFVAVSVVDNHSFDTLTVFTDISNRFSSISLVKAKYYNDSIFLTNIYPKPLVTLIKKEESVSNSATFVDQKGDIIKGIGYSFIEKENLDDSLKIITFKAIDLNFEFSDTVSNTKYDSLIFNISSSIPILYKECYYSFQNYTIKDTGAVKDISDIIDNGKMELSYSGLSLSNCHRYMLSKEIIKSIEELSKYWKSKD